MDRTADHSDGLDGATERRRRTPSLALGCGISALVHLSGLTLLHDWRTSHTTVDLARDGAIALVDLQETPGDVPLHAALTSPPPQPAAASHPSTVRTVRPPAVRVVAAAPARSTRVEADGPEPARTAAPPGAAAEAHAPSSAAVPPESPEGTTAAADEGAAALDSAMGPLAKAPHVSAGVARSLRVYDEFPSMPESARSAGVQAVNVEVCVSDRGGVSGVSMNHRATAPLESALTAAIRTWRYRPLLVKGAATPFCHEMLISYAIN